MNPHALERRIWGSLHGMVAFCASNPFVVALIPLHSSSHVFISEETAPVSHYKQQG